MRVRWPHCPRPSALLPAACAQRPSRRAQPSNPPRPQPHRPQPPPPRRSLEGKCMQLRAARPSHGHRVEAGAARAPRRARAKAATQPRAVALALAGRVRMEQRARAPRAARASQLGSAQLLRSVQQASLRPQQQPRAGGG
eukprot:scaffold236205_cov32-Tisochrysis_lutea.AAC.3